MNKLFILTSLVLLTSCINPLPDLIKGKKWHMVKQVTNTQDGKNNTTSQKLKDFSIIDKLTFEDDNKLTIKNYGKPVSYSYSIKDSILTFLPKDKNTDYERANVWRVLRSTKDSLILKRSEIWGGGVLKITATFHLAADK